MTFDSKLGAQIFSGHIVVILQLVPWFAGLVGELAGEHSRERRQLRLGQEHHIFITYELFWSKLSFSFKLLFRHNIISIKDSTYLKIWSDDILLKNNKNIIKNMSWIWYLIKMLSLEVLMDSRVLGTSSPNLLNTPEEARRWRREKPWTKIGAVKNPE